MAATNPSAMNNASSKSDIVSDANRLIEQHGKDYVISAENHPEIVKGFLHEVAMEMEKENSSSEK